MNSEKSKSPLVSIITINYKQLLLTIDLIKSLKEITYPNYELVIVENNSQEDLTPIELKFPSVKLIKSSKNLGFAGGNNLGLKQAKGDYILYLNNDTIVEKSFLEPLVNCFIENPNTGLVSPKIRYYDERNRIQFAGYTDLSKITLRNSIIGYGEIDKNQFNKRTKTAFSHGAAMMTTRKILNQSGLMSELYFLYYEELDFGIRIRKLGFDIYYEPSSLIYHKESVSTGKNSPFKTYYLARNRILYLRRHMRGIRFSIGLAYQLIVALPKNIFVFLIKLEFKHIQSYIKGLIWNITNPAKGTLHTNQDL